MSLDWANALATWTLGLAAYVAVCAAIGRWLRRNRRHHYSAPVWDHETEGALDALARIDQREVGA